MKKIHPFDRIALWTKTLGPLSIILLKVSALFFGLLVGAALPRKVRKYRLPLFLVTLFGAVYFAIRFFLYDPLEELNDDDDDDFYSDAFARDREDSFNDHDFDEDAFGDDAISGAFGDPDSEEDYLLSDDLSTIADVEPLQDQTFLEASLVSDDSSETSVESSDDACITDSSATNLSNEATAGVSVATDIVEENSEEEISALKKESSEVKQEDEANTEKAEPMSFSV